MDSSHYIVPTDLLVSSPPKCAWHSHVVPADTTQSLVAVDWQDRSDRQTEFEAQPGVLFLGERWETLPDAAAPLLASFQQTDLSTTSGATPSVPSVDVPAPAESVSAALRKSGWPGARIFG